MIYSIGELSQKTGVKVPTIRYYEQSGLIAAPTRSSGNQRRYTQKELDCLSFIKHARDLGLSIQAIQELIELNNHPEESCAHADKIAATHLLDIQERIARLQILEAELLRITEGCHGNQISECYVIHSLSNHGLCQTDHK